MKLLVVLALISGCVSQKVKVDPVRVEPIHMTIDINLHDPSKPDPPNLGAR